MLSVLWNLTLNGLIYGNLRLPVLMQLLHVQYVHFLFDTENHSANTVCMHACRYLSYILKIILMQL